MKKDDVIMLPVLLSAGFVSSLSQNLFTAALPSIMEDFGVAASTGQWLTTVYILVLGITTAVSAFLFKRFHTRGLVQVCLAGFALGGLLGYLAPSFPVLLLARILQALSGGPLLPLAQMAVLFIYPPEKQGWAIGLTGIVIGFAPAIGPTLSGIFVDAFGWRSICVFLILFAILVLIVSQFSIHSVGQRERLDLDTVSILLYSAGFSSFMLAVNQLRAGGRWILMSGLFLFGCLCLALFVHRQSRQKAPMLKVSLLRHPTLVLGILVLGANYVMQLTGTILMPMFNQTICGYSPTASGLILLPGSLLIAAICPFSGRMMDRFGARLVCMIGMGIMVVGNASMLLLPETASVAVITVLNSIRCIGIAFLTTPSTALAVRDLELSDKPHGMAIVNSLRQMSGSLFSAVLVIVAAAVSAPLSISLRGIHAAFMIMTMISVVGIGVCFLISPQKTPE